MSKHHRFTEAERAARRKHEALLEQDRTGITIFERVFGALATALVVCVIALILYAMIFGFHLPPTATETAFLLATLCIGAGIGWRWPVLSELLSA